MSEKQAELSGMELWKDVVRVKWPEAHCWIVLTAPELWDVQPYTGYGDEEVGEGATELEAWQSAAQKVLEAEGYSIYDSPRGWTWFYEGDELDGYATKQRALESAGRDYLSRNTATKIAEAMKSGIWQAGKPTQQCTCLGTCRRKEGSRLGNGWHCVLTENNSVITRPAPSPVPAEQPEGEKHWNARSTICDCDHDISHHEAKDEYGRTPCRLCSCIRFSNHIRTRPDSTPLPVAQEETQEDRYYIGRETLESLIARPVTTDDEQDIHMALLELRDAQKGICSHCDEDRKVATPQAEAGAEGELCPTCAARGTAALYTPKAWAEAKYAKYEAELSSMREALRVAVEALREIADDMNLADFDPSVGLYASIRAALTQAEPFIGGKQ